MPKTKIVRKTSFLLQEWRSIFLNIRNVALPGYSQTGLPQKARCLAALFTKKEIASNNTDTISADAETRPDQRDKFAVRPRGLQT